MIWHFITLGHIRILTIKSLFIYPILFSYTSKNIHIIIQYTRTSHITQDIIQCINVCLHMKKHTIVIHIHNYFLTNTHHLSTPPVHHKCIRGYPLPVMNILSVFRHTLQIYSIITSPYHNTSIHNASTHLSSGISINK